MYDLRRMMQANYIINDILSSWLFLDAFWLCLCILLGAVIYDRIRSVIPDPGKYQ